MLPIHGRLPPCPISYTYLNCAVSTHAWSHSCENTVRNYAVLVYFLLWNWNTFIPGWLLSHYMVEADPEPWFSFLYLLNSGIISRYHKVWISWIYFILFKWGPKILGLPLFCLPLPSPGEHPSTLETGGWPSSTPSCLHTLMCTLKMLPECFMIISCWSPHSYSVFS